MQKVKKMPIHEIFANAIQGEGMVIGQKTVFVRTGGCDYSCAWCDSAFTWNGEEKATMMTAQEVYDEIMRVGTVADGRRNFNHVTISGGNPALIGEPMDQLIDLLHAQGIRIGLETQGTFWKDWMYKINDLTISPKPPSSKMVTNFQKLDDFMEKLYDYTADPSIADMHDFSLKVVVFDDEDFEFAKKIHKRYNSVEFFLSVGNEDAKEEGDISKRLLDKLGWLWDKVVNDPEMNDAKPLPQLHTLVHANKRGV